MGKAITGYVCPICGSRRMEMNRHIGTYVSCMDCRHILVHEGEIKTNDLSDLLEDTDGYV